MGPDALELLICWMALLVLPAFPTSLTKWEWTLNLYKRLVSLLLVIGS